MSTTLTFDDLEPGDRFSAFGALWTKLSATTARKHSPDSRALGDRGYGYIGDSHCSFMRDGAVVFEPVPAARPSDELRCHCCGKLARWCGAGPKACTTTGCDHIHCDHCGMHYALESDAAAAAETPEELKALMLAAYQGAES